jgi:Cu2+-exporting ATPase
VSKEKDKICIHCGTPFSPALGKESPFCCNGCEYVYKLIKKSGLDHYYDLRDPRIKPVQPSALQPRDYQWLEARAKACEEEAGTGSSAEMYLDLEGISCVGCVWLIEKVFREMPGAIRIEINTQYGQIRLQWRIGTFQVTDFAREIQQFGYILGPPGERPQEESRKLVGKIGLSGAFALNAMLFTLPRYLGMKPDFQFASLFELLSLLFATLSLLAGGSYFIKRGIKGILQGVLHIDFPIALGIMIAWAGSLLGWFMGDVRFLYFDFVAIFIFLMLVGRWVQERALERNRNQLLSRNKAPHEVHLVEDDLVTESNKPLDALKQGQRIRVLPGEVIPVLGELESIKAAVSLEWINGESTMRTFSSGQYIPSGAQNIGIEPILLKARQTWSESLLTRLLDTHVEDQRNPFIEKVIKVYLFAVLGIAALGAAVWSLWIGDSLTALQVVLSVLVVSCPCALGVAYPLAQELAILNLRQYGIFVRTPNLFRNLGRIEQVVFDKTGTLTLEAPEVSNPEVLSRLEVQDALVLREMAKSSLHPVSRALREAFLQMDVGIFQLPEDLSISEEIGMGLVAESTREGVRWTLGRPGWLADEAGPELDSSSHCDFRRNGQLRAGFILGEAMREDAVEAVARLKGNFQITILSGDRLDKVKMMAKALKLPESAAFGEQSPEQKATFMESLGSVHSLYIGDGANDSFAFSKASVRGTPATPHGLLQDKADFYFTGRSLKGLLQLFRIHKVRQFAVRAAFGFAILYNIIVVVIALLGKMHPLLAAILMPLSSFITISLVAGIYRGNRQQSLQA